MLLCGPAYHPGLQRYGDNRVDFPVPYGSYGFRNPASKLSTWFWRDLGQRHTDASLEPTERGNVAGLGGVLCGPTGEPQILLRFPNKRSRAFRIGPELSLHLLAGASCSVPCLQTVGRCLQRSESRVLLRQRWRKSLPHDRGKLQQGGK